MGQEHNLSEQLQLFDPGPSEPKYDPSSDPYHPMNWAMDEATQWHATTKSSSPHTNASIGLVGDFAGFHVGTRASADFADFSRKSRERSYPYRLSGSSALRPPNTEPSYKRRDIHGGALDTSAWSDTVANEYYASEEMGGEKSAAYAANLRGEHVPYVNHSEDAGSISFRAAPKNVHSWSEHVLSSPDAPQHWKDIAATHELVAHVGKPKYDRRSSKDMTDIQDTLPLSEFQHNAKARRARPSAPPDAEVLGVLPNYLSNEHLNVPGSRGNSSAIVDVTPKHQYLIFEPKNQPKKKVAKRAARRKDK